MAPEGGSVFLETQTFQASFQKLFEKPEKVLILNWFSNGFLSSLTSVVKRNQIGQTFTGCLDQGMFQRLFHNLIFLDYSVSIKLEHFLRFKFQSKNYFRI